MTTRTTYRWDKAIGDWVPGIARPRKPSASAQVMPDIQPYKSMVTGEMIGGRRQHRDHLRAHGCIEVGNEFVTPKPYEPNRADIVQDIKRAMGE